MEHENFFQKCGSFYERFAKRIMILNLLVEIAIFITCCIIFLLFDKELQNIEVYKGISLIILFVSMLYFAYNSILANNVLELFAFLILSTISTYSIICMLYGIATDPNKNEGYQIFAYVSCAIILINQIFYFISWWPVYNQSIWLSYKRVGASKAMQKYYTIYQSFQTMIKVHLQISLISFWTFIIFMDDNVEYVLDSLILASILLASWLCFISTKREKKSILIAYLSYICLIEIYKFVKILFFMKNYNFALETIISDYNSRMIAIFSEIACVLSCFTLVILGKLNINNYGEGLRERMLIEPSSKIYENNL